MSEWKKTSCVLCSHCCETKGQCLEEGEIFTRLAHAMGILPEIPDSLFQRAQGDRGPFAMELVQYMESDKNIARFLSFIVAKTLGRQIGSAHLSALWGLLMMYSRHAGQDIVRAGYELSPLVGDELFRRLLDHPEGIMIAKVNPDANLDRVRTPEKRIRLYIEELAGWMNEIAREKERAAMEDKDLPFVLAAGRHFPHTANSIMRDPAWNDHKRVCTLLVCEEDARALGINDGKEVYVVVEASRIEVPVEISDIPARGTVVLPHGFGLVYEGKTCGVNVNQLTKNTHRDRITGTPLHRYVPCRLEPSR